MLVPLLLVLLGAVLLVPPVILYRCADSLTWRSRYLLSVMPATYTGGGYALAVQAFDLLGCKGGFKGAHGCLLGTVDVTLLVGHGLFLGLPFLFVAAPLSLWLLLDTATRHIGARRRETPPAGGEH